MRPTIAILAAMMTSYLLFSPARIHISEGFRFPIAPGNMLVWDHRFLHTPIDVFGTIAILAALLFPLVMLWLAAPRITATLYRYRKAILITFGGVFLLLVAYCALAMYMEASPRIRAAQNPYLQP
jgi:hypothetical protein